MNCLNTFTSTVSRHTPDHRNYIRYELKVVVFNESPVFSIDAVVQKDLTNTEFGPMKAFAFDQSDSSNANFPLVFGSTPDGLNHTTTGVQYFSYGIPGTAGAVTKLIISAGFIGPLYYYSSSQIDMGYKNE